MKLNIFSCAQQSRNIEVYWIFNLSIPRNVTSCWVLISRQVG
jgi:hypothetical protein